MDPQPVTVEKTSRSTQARLNFIENKRKSVLTCLASKILHSFMGDFPDPSLSLDGFNKEPGNGMGGYPVKIYFSKTV